MIDSNVVSVFWQMVCIVFYVFIIIFLVTLSINIISATIENYKKRKAINKAVKELFECIDKLKDENETKKLDKKDDE